MPKHAAKAPPSNDLYEMDFYAWTQEQVRIIRSGHVADADIVNLAEEIDSVGRTQKVKIASNLNIVLIHLLKWIYQPSARSLGWRGSIDEHRDRVRRIVEASPSLVEFPESVLDVEYRRARIKAALQTGLPRAAFPQECPFSLNEILDEAFPSDLWDELPGARI